MRAEIRTITGMSGHADQQGLLRWVNNIQPKPSQIYVNHGGDTVCDEFAALLNSQGHFARAPYPGTEYDLLTGEMLAEGNRVLIKKEDIPQDSRQNTVFARLMEAGKRLMTVIGHNKGGANKDLAKFADQINALCEKWDR